MITGPDHAADDDRPADAAALLAAVARLDDTLRTAEALVGAGRRIDLTGLDQQIGAASRAALLLPPGAGGALRPALGVLLARVDSLHAALRATAPA